MFRIEAFVEDKRLAEALRALTGIVRNQPSVMPVANLAEGSELKAATNGSLYSMFEAFLDKSKAESLSPADIREWLKSCGRSVASASSVSFVANLAIKAHRLRRVGQSSKTRYVIIRKKG